MLVSHFNNNNLFPNPLYVTMKIILIGAALLKAVFLKKYQQMVARFERESALDVLYNEADTSNRLFAI